jgi:hypothetical protein
MNARFLVTTSVAFLAGAAAWAEKEIVQYKDLHPFTHVAYIPASATLSSIKIEKIKEVKVDTKLRAVSDVNYCEEVPRWGPSMFCPSFTTTEAPEAAYEVVYSYKGQPIPSDEYGYTNYTFGVYFRPNEIPPALRQALASGKVSRSVLAEFFHFTTSRGSVQQPVIDEAHSFFCKGYYFDGNWMHNDPNCHDRVVYKKAWVPSSYLAVKVAPVYKTLATVAAGKSPNHK